MLLIIMIKLDLEHLGQARIGSLHPPLFWPSPIKVVYTVMCIECRGRKVERCDCALAADAAFKFACRRLPA